MNVKEYMNDNVLYLDGAMGTMLQDAGLKVGEQPENWNITHQDEMISVHKSYYEVGSNIINTNTLGANSLNFSDCELEKIIRMALDNAKRAREECSSKQEKYIALDIGSLGRILKPYGDLEFEEAVEIFSKTVKLGNKYGADLVAIETMNDIYETKAAVIAVKENCNLPIFVSNAYSENGKLMTGTNPATAISILEGLGVDAIGVNCSFGADGLLPIAEEYLKFSSLPIIMKPNAGMPIIKDGETVFEVESDKFAEIMCSAVEKGVRVVGGCCGTTPEYIKKLVDKTAKVKIEKVEKKSFSCVSSSTKTIFFGDKPILVGERINPTGKKMLKQALLDNDVTYVLNEGIKQQENGADVLDVNVGIPKVDETALLKNIVSELQMVVDLPLQIDTSNPKSMEQALRYYNGKAMVNSVNGKKESMDMIFPIVKKYGGMIVALTLDEKGIPETVEGRVEIAKRILKEAGKYGIKKEDIIFDSLVMTISTNINSANITLRTMKEIKEKLGCKTILGISNISFGLPGRETLNSIFFALALENGLDSAIMNPMSENMMQVYYSYLALRGKDGNCTDYIGYFTENKTEKLQVEEQAEDLDLQLKKAIIKGLKQDASKLTEKLVQDVIPMDIVQNCIIPALNIVGKGFEENRIYLPQLLMSAEASSQAFEIIKKKMLSDKTKSQGKRVTVVIATVKGDIHDIGKNIVKLLLENYGFRVIDLGKDVPAEVIVNTVCKEKAEIVGLSALMTTTVPAMEESIKQLRKKAEWCKIVVGGAVLTKKYADEIGADEYAQDAMQTVRYAQEISRKCKK